MSKFDIRCPTDNQRYVPAQPQLVPCTNMNEHKQPLFDNIMAMEMYCLAPHFHKMTSLRASLVSNATPSLTSPSTLARGGLMKKSRIELFSHSGKPEVNGVLLIFIHATIFWG